jgi:hypothetical protein
MNPTPDVTFLYWRECPSHEQVLTQLRRAMADAGLDADRIEITEILTDEDARRHRFPGSPTIRVNGHDIVDADDEPFALNCRIYQRRDGRVGPTPDPQDIRDALTAGVRRAEVG